MNQQGKEEKKKKHKAEILRILNNMHHVIRPALSSRQSSWDSSPLWSDSEVEIRALCSSLIKVYVYNAGGV